MGQQDAASPLRSQQWSAAVGDAATDFSVTGYSDWIMMVATQTGTLGTVMQARQDRALEGAMTYSVSTVMGRRDEPLLGVAARQLAEALSLAGCDRPLLVCIGLKVHDGDSIRAIIKEILAHPVW